MARKLSRNVAVPDRPLSVSTGHSRKHYRSIPVGLRGATHSGHRRRGPRTAAVQRKQTLGPAERALCGALSMAGECKVFRQRAAGLPRLLAPVASGHKRTFNSTQNKPRHSGRGLKQITCAQAGFTLSRVCVRNRCSPVQYPRG